jgi:uncharacterized protein YcfJ
MKHLLKTAGLASILILSSTTLLANDRYSRDYDDHYYSDRHHQQRDYNHKQMARVINVEPIYKSIRVSSPHRDCNRDYNNHRTNSYTSTIAGGIIGGVIGNQFGKGTGNTVLTVAGTLLGGSMGHDLAHNTTPSNRYDRDDSCRVSHSHQRQQLDGYFVTYKYKGQRYTTEMDRHPGKYIPVNVTVAPSYRHHH